MLKKTFSFILGLSLIAVFVGTAGYLYYKSQQPPQTFETASPVIGDIEQITIVSGAIVPRQTLRITPTLSGILEELYVQPGDPVRVGAQLAKIRVVRDLVSLNEAENRLNKARIAHTDAQQALERQQRLYQSQLISQAEFTRSQTNFQTIAAELQAAETAVRLLKKGGAARNADTEHAVLTSTTTGTILAIPVEPGDPVVDANAVSPGTTVAVIANMDDLIFKGSVGESDVGKLQEGQILQLTIGALEGQVFKATLEMIAPQGIKERDSAVQFQITAAIAANDNARLRSGYSANARITLAKKERVLTVLESLIQYTTDQQPYVEVEVGEQRFERKNIKLGVSDGVRVEVVSGVTERDKIKKPYPNA